MVLIPNHMRTIQNNNNNNVVPFLTMHVNPRILKEIVAKQMLKYIKIIIHHDPLQHISRIKAYFNIRKYSNEIHINRRNEKLYNYSNKVLRGILQSCHTNICLMVN